ncbi:ABC transporter ATP-binding protein [Pacificibacter marinus]|uniref:sn-glycerol-3-phosphate import ATP-binding protein UgpC n=1 Tax=Pacificibacter marinus TaxID=658057 RepID=A0A1Y5RGN4_9RHOB|nr:ABC transporter ATP-binding protein [Pacificibacter marinus]SEK23458.1 carbohydrate ABC transporter ATP-binding protein, CUT1 family [Pacificibacter marinus]SLN14437.1 sn-glycerol-3-phosphate import ATP-binding protein UgpC [Pacificibacter marinus]
MSSISLRTITKSFGDAMVLDGVDLDIKDGKFVTLVGPSGCGKSTLLRILAGLEATDAGTVTIGKRDVTQTRPSLRNLAMVFQSYALYPHLSVAQNMLTPLLMRDLTKTQRLPVIGPLISRAKRKALTAQVDAVAQTLKITELLTRKPGQLSGGQRQRVALGRAMVRNPVAFLMDEPLSNLDAALRVHMRSELTELHRRLKTTFVYVTHDQAEALTMSDRMAVMMGGKILQFGRPDDIYRDPNSLAVARFVGSPAINTLSSEIDEQGTLTVLGESMGRFSGLSQQSVVVGIRPEHLTLSKTGRFGGMVKHRENLGSDVFLHLVVDGHADVVVVRATPAHAPALAAQVRFTMSSDHLLIFGADGQRLRAEHTTSKVAV